jgi:amidase
MPTPPFEFDHFLSAEGMESLFAHHRNLVWVNCLGLPAVAVPDGVQVIARRFREDEALAAAAVIERALGRCTIATVS